MEQNAYSQAYAALRAGKNEPEWLRDYRDRSFARFEELGFPTNKTEDWRYTNPAPLTKGAFNAPRKHELSRAQIDSASLGKLADFRLVFVNGRYAPELSTPTNGNTITVTNLHFALTDHSDKLRGILQRRAAVRQPFGAMNGALFEDGAFVRIAANPVGASFELLFVSTGDNEMSHPMVIVAADADSRGQLIEHYVSVGADSNFTNVCAEVYLEERAHLQHVRLQRQGTQSRHLSTVRVFQAANSQYHGISYSEGAALGRNDIDVLLQGEHASATLDGLYLVAGHQNVDFHTSLIHEKPNCTSRELFKGIIGGSATAVFNGRVVVPPDSQKTDSEQGNHNLLISDDATAYTKPELEIYANDVKCAHGATVGQMDEQAVFYMRSRGLAQSQARALLTHAFGHDILSRIPVEALRTALEQEVLAWLPKAQGEVSA